MGINCEIATTLSDAKYVVHRYRFHLTNEIAIRQAFEGCQLDTTNWCALLDIKSKPRLINYCVGRTGRILSRSGQGSFLKVY